MANILPQDLARAVKSIVADCSAELDRSISALMEEADPRQISIYRRLVGETMGELFINVLAPIYQQYPELEPEELRKARSAPPELRFVSPRLKAALLKTAREVEEMLSQLVFSVKAAAGVEAAAALEVALQSALTSIAHLKVFLNNLRTTDDGDLSRASRV